MTKSQEYLSALPENQKIWFAPLFGDMERFYTVVYLIARNEHLTELEKPDRYADRLRMIRQIRGKVESLVTSYGLDGEAIVADIASDYFEDYVNYKEPSLPITNEEFVALIKAISLS